MNKEDKKKKKLKLKWQFKLIIIVSFVIIYMFFIATKGIQTKEYKINTTKIDKNISGIKIVQFSDLHFGSSIKLKDVEKLINKINENNPDVVIFTGDLIDERYELTKEEKEKLTKNLTKINAELGKYYINGEEDYEDAFSILETANFIAATNNIQAIYKNSRIPILIGGKEAITNYLEANENNFFKILLLHNPNDIDKLTKYDFDIAIAGHTHNGQVNIPKLKELFINGNHINTYEKINNKKLFINPGIGTSKVNVRLFNKPTIYLYRINQTLK